MHHPVNRRHGGHGVLEDPLPLREDQVRGYNHRSPLVTLGQKREHDLHFIAVVLNVADVIQDHTRIIVPNHTRVLVRPIPLPTPSSLALCTPRLWSSRAHDEKPANNRRLVGDLEPIAWDYPRDLFEECVLWAQILIIAFITI
jgi:hypothetical protein